LDRAIAAPGGGRDQFFDHGLRLVRDLAAYYCKGNRDLARAKALAGEGLQRMERIFARPVRRALTLARCAELFQMAGVIETSRGQLDDAHRLFGRAAGLRAVLEATS
jgi:hypothetical protein